MRAFTLKPLEHRVVHTSGGIYTDELEEYLNKGWIVVCVIGLDNDRVVLSNQKIRKQYI